MVRSVHSRRAITLVVLVALVAFLPVPFFIPFWAAALVPVSYLLLAVRHVGAVGACYALVAALGLFGIAKFVIARINRVEKPSTQVRIVVALVLILAVLSLLPIYKPGLDPERPAVNLVGLFRVGISVGQ